MKDIVIGIDIGGTNTSFGAVDKEGNCMFENSFSTSDYESIDDYLKALYNNIEESLISFKNKTNLVGIGVGAPNGNYYTKSIDYAPNLKWKGKINFVELFSNYFDNIPIALTNDANAAAIGEMLFGNAKGMKDFIVITLGTGLGSGIVSNGQLIYGYDGHAGELGHVIVDPNGRLCGCGRKGCLETYASASGIVTTICDLLTSSNEYSLLRKIPSDYISAKDITEAAKKGDKLALEAFEYTGKILGLQLANTVAHTYPEAIFLFGGVAKAGKYIFEPTQKYFEENLLNIYQNKVKILPSGFDDKNAAILGAAALIWEKIYAPVK